MGLGGRVKNHAIGMAGRADAREAADVLARAFHDDPEFSWMLPVEDTRNRRLRRYFVTELRHGSLRHGGVEVARDSGRIAGVAVAIGFAVFYIVVSGLFEAMGNINQLPPVLAAWAPDVIFALAGGYLILKVPT